MVLIDEVGASGLPPRTHQLLHALQVQVDVIAVARCYLKPSHRGRALGVTNELYGFSAEDYEAKLTTFAARIVETHGPHCALSFDSENAHLVVLLDRLDVPVICCIDKASGTRAAQDRLTEIMRHSEAILVRDKTILDDLDTARDFLDRRAYTLVSAEPCLKPSSAVESRPGLLERLWRRLTSNEEIASIDPAFAEALTSASRDAAEAARHRAPIMERDRQTIRASGHFSRDLYHPVRPVADEVEAITDYLRSSRRAIPRDRPLAGHLVKRPSAGFNPFVYAERAPDFEEKRGDDPFAHFLRADRPDGPWRHDVIGPTAGTRKPYAGRVGLHAHMHYPDLLADLLARLEANASLATLFITTTSPEGEEEILNTLRQSPFEPEVTIVENRGRDLWPFLGLLSTGRFEAFDVVGHVHSKRTPAYLGGDVWRDFLWTHLIGGKSAMMDTILDRFRADEKLGLVFPEDPHLDGWEDNKAVATELARQANIDLPLPNHFDYPMGNMFWARPAALAPLCNLDLTRDMIPEEPVPRDGTILHAAERLIPFVAAQAGYRYATTHVPGSTR